MKNIVTFSRVLGDLTRWRIVRLVMDEAMCVCELADILGMPQSSVSSHVQIIRKAGLLEREACGKWTYFRIRAEYLPLLGEMLGHFPESAADAGDRKKAAARLARRESSCCPGPTRLANPDSTKCR